MQADLSGAHLGGANLCTTRGSGGLQYAAAWEFQRSLLAHLETVWRTPDDGIWEVRGERRHFTSKVMVWVAFDRAIMSAESFGLEGPVEHRRRIRAEIHDEVCRRAFNTNLGAFRPGLRQRLVGRERVANPAGYLSLLPT